MTPNEREKMPATPTLRRGAQTIIWEGPRLPEEIHSPRTFELERKSQEYHRRRRVRESIESSEIPNLEAY